MLTKPTIEKSKRLSNDEREEKFRVFERLLAKLEPFIQAQAAQRACKLPSSYIDEDDLKAVGNIQTWIATITWDPERGASLENWARRRIWSNMNVLMGNIYQQKRVPRKATETGSGVTSRPISIFTEDENGLPLYETLEDHTFSDPIGLLIADELYGKTREKLLSQDNRLAAAVLRLSVFPDSELLRLCERNSRGGRKVRITNRSIAERLGTTTSQVAGARASIRAILREYSEG